MMGTFVKYPSTPHLVVLGGASVREDKVLTPAERDRFLGHDVILEEKIDGANLGISFDSTGAIRAQNRGSILSEPMTGQWKTLPDWLIGFDIFDFHANRYVCRDERDRLMASLELHVVPFLACGRLTLEDVNDFFGQSRYGNAPAEGLCLRYDDGDWLGHRAKLVRPDFTQAMEEHWSSRPLEVNRLAISKITHW